MTENNIIDPTRRSVVNASYDVTNIVRMDNTVARINKTLDHCISILKEHCGPNSGYAMLVSDESIGATFQPNVFTRDGIRILSAVEFMSPLERYIKDLITYIGQRVDVAAKDGTTTSMLFSALLLKAMMEHIDILTDNHMLTHYQLNNMMDDIISRVTAHIEKEKYTVESISEIIDKYNTDISEDFRITRAAGAIAFMQALSSSGGNIDLAVAMKEIFSNSPKVTWDFITSHRSIKENGKSYQVEVADYDARIKCILASARGLNKMLNTEYEEEARVVIYPGSIDDVSFDSELILKYLKEDTTDEPIIVVSSYFGGRITSEINHLNNDRKNPIVLWQYCPEQKIAGQDLPWELVTICAIAGIVPINFIKDSDYTKFTDENTFKTKVHWRDGYLHFYDIIEKDETTGCLHPFYVYPEKATEFYNELRKSLEKQIHEYKEGHRPDGKSLSFFMEVLNRLATVRRPTLRLGGPVHEQMANSDIIQDVQGATMTSLTHGFFINGTISIRKILVSVLKEISDEYEENIGPVQKATIKMVSLMVDAIEEVYRTVSGETNDMAFAVCGTMDKFVYINSLNKDENSSYSKAGRLTVFLNEMEDFINNKGGVPDVCRTYPILQPVTILTEILKRMKELLIKVVVTNKFIVYGGVVVNDEKGE